jgi:hypothetical protein
VQDDEDSYFILMLVILTVAGYLAISINLPGIVGAFLAVLAIYAAVHDKPAKGKLPFFADSLTAEQRAKLPLSTFRRLARRYTTEPPNSLGWRTGRSGNRLLADWLWFGAIESVVERLDGVYLRVFFDDRDSQDPDLLIVR